MFNYKEISYFKSLPTPFYYYNFEILIENLKILKHAAQKFNVKVHYAIKANNNIPILKKICSYGLGADCVSGMEVKRAIESGYSPEDIVFAGVGKTDEEIEYSLDNNISCINCESVHELKVINEIAGEKDKIAPIALRINPDFNGKTHHKITTGTKLNKFGIPKGDIIEAIKVVKKSKNIQFKGLHFHIGSQIRDMKVFADLTNIINEIQEIFQKNKLPVYSLNLGGGLGVDYLNPDNNPIPDYHEFFSSYMKNLKRFHGQEVSFELGRSIVAECGSLISRVLFLKNSGSSIYAIIDAGMNDLMRPALYGSEHKIQNITGIGQVRKYHIAGPVCESSDVFGTDVKIPNLQRRDLVAIRTSGAYGESMSSTYNLRKPATAIYSSDILKKTDKYKHLSTKKSAAI